MEDESAEMVASNHRSRLNRWFMLATNSRKNNGVLKLFRDLKWLCITIGIPVTLVLALFGCVYILLKLPFPYNTILYLSIVIAWGLASGVKEWYQQT